MQRPGAKYKYSYLKLERVIVSYLCCDNPRHDHRVEVWLQEVGRKRRDRQQDPGDGELQSASCDNFYISDLNALARAK